MGYRLKRDGWWKFSHFLDIIVKEMGLDSSDSFSNDVSNPGNNRSCNQSK